MHVEVMLPAYGDGELTRLAVASVLGQDTPTGWNVTIVDDGGDAALGRWVADLDDARVAYRANPQRLGINRNFQRCVDLATGDLVVVMGNDDLMDPDYIRTVASLADRYPHVWAIHPGVSVIGSAGEAAWGLVDRAKALLRGREHDREQVRGGEELAASLLHGNWMYFPSVAFRREELVRYGFTPGLDIVLDLDLYLRQLVDGGTFCFSEHRCFRYRRHAASLSSVSAGWGSRFEEERAYFTQAEVWMDRQGWPRAARAARWHVMSRLNAASRLPRVLATRDRPALRRLLWHALRPLPPTRRAADPSSVDHSSAGR